MEKSRVVNSCDFGVLRADNKYARAFVGGPSYTEPPEYTVLKDQTLGRHYAYSGSAASKSLSVTFLQQQEKFWSTERRKPAFNSCKHTVLKTFNYPFTNSYLEPYYNGRVNTTAFNRIKNVSTSYTLAKVDWSGVSQNLQAEAYHTMLPRFEGDISIINTLFELKDFRDVSDALVKNVEQVGKLLNIKTSFSAATKLLASARLTDALAIRPTINEFIGLARDCTNIVEDVQREFRDKGQQPNIRHFSKTLDQSQSLFDTISDITSYDYVKVKKGSKSFRVFTATMEGDYGYTMRSRLDAFGKYWGLGISAEALWNMLPLSFVIDYIFGIGHSLDVMRHDKNVQYHVRQYSESLLHSITSGTFLTRGNRNCYYRGYVVDKDHFFVNNDDSFSVPIAGTYSSDYERVVKSPYWGLYLPELRVPSKNQIINMAALARCFI